MIWKATIMAVVMLMAGCASSHQPLAPAAQTKSWSRSLSDEEKVRCKQAAWQAASSWVMAERFKLDRMTREPLKLNENGIAYYVEGERFDKVEVAIPNGGRVGWHSAFIGVTVARGTYEVLEMRESYWP